MPRNRRQPQQNQCDCRIGNPGSSRKRSRRCRSRGFRRQSSINPDATGANATRCATGANERTCRPAISAHHCRVDRCSCAAGESLAMPTVAATATAEIAAGTTTIAISRSSTRATRAPGRYRDRTAGGNVNCSVRTATTAARPAAEATADAIATRRPGLRRRRSTCCRRCLRSHRRLLPHRLRRIRWRHSRSLRCR